MNQKKVVIKKRKEMNDKMLNSIVERITNNTNLVKQALNIEVNIERKGRETLVIYLSKENIKRDVNVDLSVIWYGYENNFILSTTNRIKTQSISLLKEYLDTYIERRSK